MKLAIVGSANVKGSNRGLAKRLIEDAIEKHKPDVIVSGGADGVDTFAELIARHQFDLPVIVCKPAHQSWPHFKKRNQLIADLCDGLVRIVNEDSKTYGSGWTRDRVDEQGKPTEEYKLPA